MAQESPPTRKTPDSDTLQLRIAKYKRRVSLINWVGAGLLAEVTVYASIRFADSGIALTNCTALLMAFVPTLILFGGFSLALARVQFEWQLDLLQRYTGPNGLNPWERLSDVGNKLDKIEKEENVRISRGWPNWAERFYVSELILCFVAGVLLVLLIWYPFWPSCVTSWCEPIRSVPYGFSP